MNHQVIELLAERVECLERENRRWRRGVFTLLIGGLVTVAGAAQLDNGPKVVEAERFVVRDKDGKERIRLGLSTDGSPALFLWNKVGADRVVLQASDQDESGSLNLFGSGKERRELSMVVLDAGRQTRTGPSLALRRDNQGINLDVDTTGFRPWLRFQNENGVFFEAPEKPENTFRRLGGR